MNARTCLLMWLLLARNVVVCHEQPSTSVMRDTQRFVDLNSRYPLWFIEVALGWFGAETLKKVHITTQYQSMLNFDEFRSVGNFELGGGLGNTYTRNANGQVSGGRGLKASQHYPDGFGDAVRRCYLDLQMEAILKHNFYKRNSLYIKSLEPWTPYIWIIRISKESPPIYYIL